MNINVQVKIFALIGILITANGFWVKRAYHPAITP